MAAGVALIAGLGNPGAEYDDTRHNVGFWLVDALAAKCGERFKREAKFHGEACRVDLGGQPVWLLKPLTFMNRSGQSIGALATFYKIAPAQVLVVHDELDLPAGTVKFKRGGGHGGHNGLRSIMDVLATPEFWRLRFGIGHPGDKSKVVDYVLHAPSRDDRAAIEARFSDVIDVLPLAAAGETERAMNRLHAVKKAVAE